MGFEIVVGHQPSELWLISNIAAFVDGADDVVDVGVEQEHRAVIVGGLDEVANDVDAVLEFFLSPVLRMVNQSLSSEGPFPNH